MSNKKPIIEDLLFTLKQQRDELRVQANLAGKEVKDELQGLEHKYDKLTSEYDNVKHAVTDSAGEVFSSLELVAEELKNSFTRITKQLRK
ncbi:MAG: hypothetical protein COA73_13285 [Candidatus Hydrogenedentota bacterium]|nr:MAG: hypothetical protein COA73_13285 [Candidatus Hydrogenedentota bacterium]